MAQPMRRVQLLARHVSATPFDATVATPASTVPFNRLEYLYQEVLSEVCTAANAKLAAYWVYDEMTGRLHVAGSYLAAHSTDCDVLRTTKSGEMIPGFGAVGRVYKSQKSEFFIDSTELTDDCFISADIADMFSLDSVAFTPFLNGVLELGTALREDTFQWVSSRDK